MFLSFFYKERKEYFWMQTILLWRVMQTHHIDLKLWIQYIGLHKHLLQSFTKVWKATKRPLALQHLQACCSVAASSCLEPSRASRAAHRCVSIQTSHIFPAASKAKSDIWALEIPSFGKWLCGKYLWVLWTQQRLPNLPKMWRLVHDFRLASTLQTVLIASSRFWRAKFFCHGRFGDGDDMCLYR